VIQIAWRSFRLRSGGRHWRDVQYYGRGSDGRYEVHALISLSGLAFLRLPFDHCCFTIRDTTTKKQLLMVWRLVIHDLDPAK
jgi:hypothetical protein